MAARKQTSEWAKLVSVVARLRGPGGCPWDRAQTHVSLIKYLREEALEVEKALKRGRWHEIEDELGDLLLQVLLHCEIERERGTFDIEDVAKAQRLKLVRRHPHVFGDAYYRTAEDVLRDWKKIKRGERRLRRQDLSTRAARLRAKRPGS